MMTGLTVTAHERVTTVMCLISALNRSRRKSIFLNRTSSDSSEEAAFLLLQKFFSVEQQKHFSFPEHFSFLDAKTSSALALSHIYSH
jgi:hypothetical protein